jgi:hypothetical protein
MLREGNIKDLVKLPVIKNDDGSISTVKSISINVDGKEFLIPTIIDGKQLSNKDAIDYFMKNYDKGTHQYFGVFKTAKDATKYGEYLSKALGEIHKSNAAGTPESPKPAPTPTKTSALNPFSNKSYKELSEDVKNIEDLSIYAQHFLISTINDKIKQYEETLKALHSSNSHKKPDYDEALNNYKNLLKEINERQVPAPKPKPVPAPEPAAPASATPIGSGNVANPRFSKLSNEDLSLIVASQDIKKEHRAEAMKEMNTRIQNVAIFNKEDPSLLNGISIQDVTNFAKEFYNASAETYDISLGVLLGTLVGSKAFNFAAKDYQSLVSQLGGPQALALATQAMFKLSVNDKKTFESITNYIKPALKKITAHTNKLNNLYKSTADPTKVGSKTISSVNPHVLNNSYNKALLDLERRSGAIKHLLSDSNLLQKYTQLRPAGRKVMLDQLGKIPYSDIDHVETILLDPKYTRFLDYVKTIMQ